MALTTIQITTDTRQKLALFRDYPRETYEEVINKLMAITKKITDEGELSDETLEDIRVSNEQYKREKGYSTRQLLKELEARRKKA